MSDSASNQTTGKHQWHYRMIFRSAIIFGPNDPWNILTEALGLPAEIEPETLVGQPGPDSLAELAGSPPAKIVEARSDPTWEQAVVKLDNKITVLVDPLETLGEERVWLFRIGYDRNLTHTWCNRNRSRTAALPAYARISPPTGTSNSISAHR